MKSPTHLQLARRYLVLFGLLCACSAARAQLDLQRQLQHGIGATLANPSLFQDHTYTGQLFSGMGMATATVNPTQVGYTRSGLNVDEDRLLNLVKPSNHLVGEYEIGTLGFNYRRGGLQYGVSHAFRNQLAFETGAELVRLALLGTGALPGSGGALDIWPKFEQVSYHQLATHLGARLSRHLTVGVSAKLLLGTTASSFDVGYFDVARRPDPAELAVDTEAAYATAGHVLNPATGGYAVSPAQWRPVAGAGFAVDLGFTVRPAEGLQVGAVLADLGSLRWRRRTVDFTFTGTSTTRSWTGSVFDQETQTIFLEVNDSIRSQNGSISDSTTFTTRLSPKLNLFARYRVGQATDLTFGAQMQQTVVRTTALSVGIAHHIGDFVHVGVVAGLQGGLPLVGGRVSTQWYGVELYALVDNVTALADPYTAQRGHVRVGLNVAFGKVDAARDWRAAWFDRRPTRRRGVFCP